MGKLLGQLHALHFTDEDLRFLRYFDSRKGGDFA